MGIDQDWVLALDQGGHATRALVFDAAGRQVARAEQPLATQRPQAGWVEHVAADVLASLRTCLAEIADALGSDVRRLGVAALATQRSSIVCWSRSQRTALSPVLSWQDVRAAAELERLGLDASEVHALTGLRISPHYGASKLRWCLDHLPAVGSAQARGDLMLGPLASWLVYALSEGRCCAIDPCNASRTLLWDVNRRDWSPRLLQAFGIAAELLPTCLANAADWAALRVGDNYVPLCVVSGDQSVVPYAFATPTAGAAFLTLGTGAFLQQVEGAAPTACAGLLNSVIWQDGTLVQYALEGTVNGAGAALTWLAERERRTEAELLAALPAWLAASDDPPLFINAVGGLAAPFWKPIAQSAFVGSGDLAARAVAVIESIAFLVQANLDAMRDGGRAATSLVVVGGLARLDGLVQRIAALSGLPVQRASEVEATAYGAARLACEAASGRCLPPLLSAATPPIPMPERLVERYQRSLAAWRAW